MGLSTRPHPVLSKEFKHLTIGIPDLFPHVTIVSLNRPQKLNAMHGKLWREIGLIFSKLGTMGDDCRCILLTGKGRGFSAGIDIQDLAFDFSCCSIDSGEKGRVDPARQGLAMISKIQQMQDCFTQLEKCPVPVVVALHGLCIGAGIDLACCADVRLSAPNTIFSVREAKMGLAADIGTLQRLPKITGNASWVNDVCLTGRNFNAQEALAMGFISQIIAPATTTTDATTHLEYETFLQHCIQLCQSIAVNSPVAVLGTKKALLYARDHSVQDGLEQIIAYNALALQSKDLQQSIRAAKEKRQASFPALWAHSKL